MNLHESASKTCLQTMKKIIKSHTFIRKICSSNIAGDFTLCCHLPYEVGLLTGAEEPVSTNTDGQFEGALSTLQLFGRVAILETHTL